MTTETGTRPTFIETSVNAYPYHTLHTAECKTAARAKYPTMLTFEQAAEKEDNRYNRWDFHKACIPQGGDVWTALIRRAGEIRRARQADEALTSLLQDIAVVTVALERMKAEAGALHTDDEARLAEYIEGVRDGSFTPRLDRNIAKVAMPDRDR